MKRGMTLWRYFTDSQEHAGGFIMVKAVVGANWGDEGKGKITDMLAEKADIIIRFRVEQMPDIQLSMITANSLFIHYRQEFSTDIQPVSSAMVSL